MRAIQPSSSSPQKLRVYADQLRRMTAYPAEEDMDLVRAILFVVEDCWRWLLPSCNRLLQALRSHSQGQAPGLRVPTEELSLLHAYRDCARGGA